ncbi:MAG: response regulator transcription factor [Gemmatimonadota bacterium]
MTGPLAGRTVVIADDHRLFAEGVATILRDEGCHTFIVTELDQIRPTIESARPDLLVLDLAFGEQSAMPLLRALRMERHPIPILVISASEEGVIVERVRETGAAYVAKSRAGVDIAVVALQLVTDSYRPPGPRPGRRPDLKASVTIGGITLNHGHLEVLRLIRDGRSNPEIAGTISRAVKTVESRISELYARTGLRTRGQLIRWANDHAKLLKTPADGT